MFVDRQYRRRTKRHDHEADWVRGFVAAKPRQSEFFVHTSGIAGSPSCNVFVVTACQPGADGPGEHGGDAVSQSMIGSLELPGLPSNEPTLADAG